MQELLKSCQSLIMPRAIEKNLVLHFYAEPTMDVRPLGDPVRLRQVLVNLLSNAVKFTDTGTVKLVVEIVDKTEKTITMSFEVKDSGIGMTDEQIARVFDPFTQAEAGTTRKFGGTGLGLSITKKILEAMGGAINVESTPGVGSRFSFELTFNTVNAKNSGLVEKVIYDEIEKPTFEGEVLLCEDNIANQQVICEHLSRVGLKTLIAENGKIGVDFVQDRINSGRKQFDLIFMDMHMPVMDGLEAVAKILELNTGIPIVALTANIMADDRDVYKASGIKDFVGKPFTSQELWHCLLRYFKPVDWRTEDKAKRLQKEKDLKQMLIDIFVKTNQNIYEEIDEAIKSENIELAFRLSHSLKANAAQLDKKALQQAAETIEASLKNEENNVSSEDMATLKEELDAVLTELTPLVSVAEIPAAIEQLGSEDASILLDELEPYLKRGNPECLPFVDKLRAIPGSEEMIEYMESYDFSKAAEALTKLRKGGF